MMNMLKSRLVNSALIVAAAAALPVVASAQDAAVADNTNAIGLLVVWLLAVGGILAVVTMIAMDKSAQASRTTRR